MLYVLPPPRAPNPPSPWESILCAGGSSNASGVVDRTPWGDVKPTTRRPPPRAKCPNLKIRTKADDSSCTVPVDDDDTAKTIKSLSECYFAGKGTALVLPPHERLRPSRRSSTAGSDIQQHLQSMFYLLRQEETLKMAVKLESVHPGRTRYLVVVSCVGRQAAEESCLLGIDCNERTTVGLVLRVLADTTITLDGDGGFSVSVCGRHHIFKPVSVQAMWSALQTLHKVSSKAREQNYFQGGPTHDWVNYYEQHIESDRSCLNEWHAMDSLESRRPPSPDSVRTKPRERDETEQVIRSTLKEIMMSVDLDEVTSKYIRSRLEEDLDMDLGEFKSFIDQEMLTILGQMDAPTEIFDHVYLGSEWNASNFEELQKNGVGHILNVTREIDNFFPGMFNYLNIRVYDDEKTDLLKYWDNTFKYITKAKKEGSKVLVHCKMGVSRSASVVIAYAMKAYNWDFNKALKHVKEKRSCIKPNTSFIAQLETYQGILDAMKNKEKLQRSKSETNLKSPELVSKSEKRVLASAETNSVAQSQERDPILQNTLSGHDLRQFGARPKSWSPDVQMENNLLLDRGTAPVFLSLENLSKDNSSQDSLSMNAQTSPEVRRKSTSCPSENARHVLMPLNNGQSYSVSPNQIVHICKKRSESIKPSVKHRINELMSQSTGSASKKLTKDKKSLVLNLTTQFEVSKSKPNSPVAVDAEIDAEDMACKIEEDSAECAAKLVPPMLTAKLVKKEIWDPGETKPTVVSYGQSVDIPSCENCDSPKILTSKDSVVWTSSTVLKPSVPLLNSVDKNVENSKLNVVCKDSVNNPTPEVFCSKTVLGVIGSSSNKVVPATRKDGDPFSSHVDKVFDREERKQQRNSIVVPTTVIPPPPSVTDSSNEDIIRECPSRQSSWSSYDSAVVLGYQGETRDAPSRHSSWGSGDTRTLPSRNSSWGSYDMRPGQLGHALNDKGEKATHQLTTSDLFESTSSGLFPYDRDDIPWYPGTVRRTKQKLEGNKDSEKRVCHDAKSVDFADNASINSSNSLVDVKPHKSPSTETLTSDYSVSVLSETEGPVETYNTGLLHYRSSPDLCETKKDNQRAMSSVVDQPFHSTKAISKEIDIVSDSDIYSNSHRNGGSRLSVSAPESSSINLMSNECVPLSSCSVSNISTVENGADVRNNKSAFDAPSSSVMYTAQCSFVKKHKNYLENLQKETEFASRRNFPVDTAHNENENNGSCMSGIVKSLKKEFEAKTSTKPEQLTATGDNISLENDQSTKIKTKGNSLPSSPVNSTYADCRSSTAEENRDSIEDISVKELVGKYEVVGTNLASNNKSSTAAQETPTVKSRSVFDKKLFSNNQNKNMRYSCIEVLSDAADKLQRPILISPSSLYNHDPEVSVAMDGVPKRPPASTGGPLPSVVMATVVKAATKKQKHSKKDAHNCLNIKPRNNNPVYNTM